MRARPEVHATTGAASRAVRQGACAWVAAWMLVTAVAAAPASAATCTPGGILDAEGYWLHNNQWGRDMGAGEQCVWTSGADGNGIAWGTRWSWSGSASAVKSYGSAVLGWHWGVRRGGSLLPVRLSAIRAVPTAVRYEIGDDGAKRVAHTLWIHKGANPGPADDPADEVAIWTYRSGGSLPSGNRQATVTLAGASWDLYRGGAGWNVYTFVRASNTASVTLDLADFLHELTSRGWLADSKQLTGIEHGVEVLEGRSRFDVRSYSVSVR